MGDIVKLIDAALFFFFLVIAIAAPLIDAQILLPSNLQPVLLIELKNWYVKEFDDYFIVERPHFFVGLIWVELLFQWPLALLCLYGIAASKYWVKTMCLMHGSSTLTGLAVLLAEVFGSKGGRHKLIATFIPVLCFCLLSILRGLLSPSPPITSSSSSSKKSFPQAISSNGKKNA